MTSRLARTTGATRRERLRSNRPTWPERGGSPMRPTPIRAILAVPLALALVGCGASTGGSTTAPVAPASPAASAVASTSGNTSPSQDLLADLDIGGGRTMHILCVGPVDTGKPTVIFESGLGGDAGQWGDVLHALDGTVRACAYDRAGSGQSPPADAATGRTTSDQVADLRALLTAAPSNHRTSWSGTRSADGTRCSTRTSTRTTSSGRSWSTCGPGGQPALGGGHARGGVRRAGGHHVHPHGPRHVRAGPDPEPGGPPPRRQRGPGAGRRPGSATGRSSSWPAPTRPRSRRGSMHPSPPRCSTSGGSSRTTSRPSPRPVDSSRWTARATTCPSSQADAVADAIAEVIGG